MRLCCVLHALTAAAAVNALRMWLCAPLRLCREHADQPSGLASYCCVGCVFGERKRLCCVCCWGKERGEERQHPLSCVRPTGTTGTTGCGRHAEWQCMRCACERVAGCMVSTRVCVMLYKYKYTREGNVCSPGACRRHHAATICHFTATSTHHQRMHKLVRCLVSCCITPTVPALSTTPPFLARACDWLHLVWHAPGELNDTQTLIAGLDMCWLSICVAVRQAGWAGEYSCLLGLLSAVGSSHSPCKQPWPLSPDSLLFLRG